MFVDKLDLKVIAGKGGDGAKTFRREKFVANGGPDGGDGGDGGDVIFKVDTGMRTLMDYKFQKTLKAEDGENGKRKQMFGKNGKDLIVPVPPGTVVKNQENGVIMADLTEEDDQVIIAKGGRGGKGNARYKSSTRRAPNFSEPGYEGESYDVTIELKMIADVGLLGYPNVGKSTFLSHATGANPKIANYHFTTLKPNLGVVNSIPGKSFVIADIPGIINGASKGIGLGFDFLRHIERTKLLIHVVDVSGFEGRDPVEDFEKLNQELHDYNEQLSNRVQVIAANKKDLVYDDEKLDEFKEEMESRGYEVFFISAVTGEGLEPLLKRVTELLETIEVEPLFEDAELIVEFKDDKDRVDIYIEKGIYFVQGKSMDRLIQMTDFNHMDSVRRFHRILKKKGILKKLRKLGVKDGDTVRIADYELEYIE